MISHEHRCIFIHIPKCGGTSVEKVLGHFSEYEGRGRQDHRSIRMLCAPSWRNLLNLPMNWMEVGRRVKYSRRNLVNPKNRLGVSSKQYDEYFKFTFVRNPWARAYSWYRNVVRDAGHCENYGITSDCSFDDFLVVQVGRGMLRPQTEWLRGPYGEIEMDFIGRFEDLQAEFETACELMNIEKIELPKLLNSGVAGYQEAYSEKGVELVRKIYSEEIAMFGYTFE